MLIGDLRVASTEWVPAGGEVLIPCLPDSWVALRFQPAGGLVAMGTLVAPAPGRRQVRLLARDGRQDLLAMVWNAALDGPASAVQVTAWQDAGRDAVPVQRVETDLLGLARLALAPGRYTVTAGQASPVAPSPARAIAVVGHPTAADLAVELALAQPAHTVTVRATSAFATRTGLQPRLFLRRRDDGSGSTVPATEELRPGIQTLVLRAPTGDYEVAVLPLGDLIVDAPIVPVRDRALTVDVRLRDNPHTCHVILAGLEPSQGPFHVFAQPVGHLHEGDPHLLFCGPWTWRTGEGPVRQLRDPVRLVAWSRNMHWISAGAVRLDRNQASVTMVPGCRLTLVLDADHDQPAQTHIALVGQGSAHEAVALHRTLATELRRAGIQYRGNVVVPAGPICVELAPGSAGLADAVMAPQGSMLLDLGTLR